MGSIDISISAEQRIGQIPQAVARIVSEDLRQFRREWREILISVWPVDTGRSLQAWENKVSGTTWILRNPVEYAEFVHPEGSTTEVWRYLQAEAERMVASAVPKWQALIRGLRVRPQGRIPAQARQPNSILDALVFNARSLFNLRTGADRRARDLRARLRPRER